MSHSGAGRALLADFGYATQDLTLGRVLARQCARQPNKVFLTYLGDQRSYTYGDIERISNRLANGLLSLGIGRGAHVALIMENSPEFIFLVLALGKIGAVSVPVNTAAKGRLLHYYLAQSDAAALLIDATLLERVQAIDPAGLKLRDLVVVGETDDGEASAAHGWRCWDYARDLANADERNPGVEVQCSDLAFLSYTSGTTGPSKGNMLCHAAALGVGLSNAEHYGYRADDVVYTCLPLFHLNALQAATFGALVSGASLVLSRRFSVSNYWREVRECRATITNLLGSMLNFLWNQPPSPDDTHNDLRMASCVPVPRFGREFERRFGLSIISNYALSDYGMVTAYTTADPPEKFGSAGKPRLNFEVRIVDEHDFELEDGRTGEIVARTTMPWRAASGYYNMPERTLEAHRNLWFHTGDRGYFDADGYLYFVDRKKDAIRRRGENISAFEVERIIEAHPAVAESAVFPVRAEGGSEDEVAVALILKPDARATETELVEYCRDNMAYFMVPRYVELRAEFPRTLNQKIEKYQLRQAMEANLERAWDREKAGIAVRL
jgi:crotonobetaine/carnitine-CoA ligase